MSIFMYAYEIWVCAYESKYFLQIKKVNIQYAKGLPVSSYMYTHFTVN